MRRWILSRLAACRIFISNIRLEKELPVLFLIRRDVGSHVENAVAMMTGLKIRRVLARMDKLIPVHVLDDNDMVLVEYEGGAVGAYWTSQIAIGHDNDLIIRIFGEKGTIEWKQTECEKVRLYSSDGTRSELHRGDNGIEEAAAKYGRLPSDHTEGVRFIHACLRSSNEGNIWAEMK